MKACRYCFKKYKEAKDVTACEKSHFDDLFFLPIFKTDLALLMRFLQTGERDLVTERLYNTIANNFSISRFEDE